MKINFDLDDLTNSALKRLVKQLVTASDKDEKKILDRLMKGAKAHEDSESKGEEDKERNDLTDLDEEMHGKPNTPMVEDDDAFAKRRKKK
jgi:hypothetical protein